MTLNSLALLAIISVAVAETSIGIPFRLQQWGRILSILYGDQLRLIRSGLNLVMLLLVLAVHMAYFYDGRRFDGSGFLRTDAESLFG